MSDDKVVGFFKIGSPCSQERFESLKFVQMQGPDRMDHLAGQLPLNWPQNDREWARSHVGCNVTTCPNGKCRATGACQDVPHVESPPLVPLSTLSDDEFCCAGLREKFCKKTAVQCSDCPWVARFPALSEPVESPPLAPLLARTIIAFTGLAGSGKSTAAEHLVKHRGFERVRFAGPLKAMMAALGLTAAEIDGDRKETPCEMLGGKTPRWAMQSLGTEWGRELIAKDLWIRAWQAALAKVPAGVPVVVDDCRFPNEAAAVIDAGGILVRIERPGAGTNSVHTSEQQALPVSRTLHNTLSRRNMLEQVDILLCDLSWADRHATA